MNALSICQNYQTAKQSLNLIQPHQRILRWHDGAYPKSFLKGLVKGAAAFKGCIDLGINYALPTGQGAKSLAQTQLPAHLKKGDPIVTLETAPQG